MTDRAEPSDAERPSVAHYRLWRTNFRVTASDACVANYLHRLCHQFEAEPAEDAVELEVRRGSGGGWEICEDGDAVQRRKTAVGAARHVEWRMVRMAARAEQEYVHWHGAALTRRGHTLLIPGAPGTGKTTLGLALTVQGFELIGDDVVFMEPDSGAVHPFHRALQVRDDAIPRLDAAGVQFRRSLRLPGFFEAGAVDHWRFTPSPPLSHVLFVEWETHGPVEVMPITQAEAAIELRRFSYNLRQRADGGWPVLQRVLAPVACYRLLGSDSLRATAAVIRDLVDRGPV